MSAYSGSSSTMRAVVDRLVPSGFRIFQRPPPRSNQDRSPSKNLTISEAAPFLSIKVPSGQSPALSPPGANGNQTNLLSRYVSTSRSGLYGPGSQVGSRTRQ